MPETNRRNYSDKAVSGFHEQSAQPARDCIYYSAQGAGIDKCTFNGEAIFQITCPCRNYTNGELLAETD